MKQKYFPDIKAVAFDIETEPDKNIFSYCLGYHNGDVEVCRLDRPDSKGKNFEKLQRFFNDTSVAKICHSLHFELKHTPKLVHIPEETVWHDTLLMSQILKNNSPHHDLGSLGYYLGGYPLEQDKEIDRLFKLYKNYKLIPENKMYPYQVADGERTMLLYRLFWPMILEQGLEEVYHTEIELVKTTVRMESVGLKLHPKTPDEMINKLTSDVNNLQVNIYDKFGRFINLGSEKQLSRLLYKELGYNPLSYSIKTGAPKTDKYALRQLRENFPDDKIFDLILEQRSISKAISTIQKFKKFAVDGIVYPNIGTNEAKTGRQTSKDPPLHNVSKNAALDNPYHVPLRGCFTVHEGHIMYMPDFQGIEMRLMVGISGDEIMRGIIDRDEDVHQEFMECVRIFMGQNYISILKEADPDLYKQFRDVDKNGHFATGYGAAPLKVAKTCKINMKDFMTGFNLYRQRHPKIVSLLKDKIKEVRENGYVTTAYGRKLYLNQEDAHAGLNYEIQGTASEILKRAQIRTDRLLKTKYNDEIRLVLSVHDEMFLTFPRHLLPYKYEFFKDVSKIMTTMPEINVKLGVEWKSTKTTWNKTKPEAFNYAKAA